jgi:hypothetical protein
MYRPGHVLCRVSLKSRELTWRRRAWLLTQQADARRQGTNGPGGDDMHFANFSCRRHSLPPDHPSKRSTSAKPYVTGFNLVNSHQHRCHFAGIKKTQALLRNSKTPKFCRYGNTSRLTAGSVTNPPPMRYGRAGECRFGKEAQPEPLLVRTQ